MRSSVSHRRLLHTRVRRNRPKNAVIATENARSKEKCGRRTTRAAISERQSPQPVNLYRQVIGVEHISDPCPGGDVVCRDGTTAEVPDQEVIAESTEARGRLYHAPGSVQVKGMLQPENQIARCVIDVNIAIAWSRYVTVLGGVLFSIGYS